jgi:copper resistance protein C
MNLSAILDLFRRAVGNKHFRLRDALGNSRETPGVAKQVALRAFLDHAVPGVGLTVSGSPRELRLYFTMGVVTAFSGVQITSSMGAAIPTSGPVNDPSDQQIVIVRFKRALPPDTYTVSWHGLWASELGQIPVHGFLSGRCVVRNKSVWQAYCGGCCRLIDSMPSVVVSCYSCCFCCASFALYSSIAALISGAAGATGRVPITQALAQGHQVTAFVRTPAKFDLNHARPNVVQGDVADAAAVERRPFRTSPKKRQK